MTYALHLGDCLEVMATLPDGSVDAVITDPPYGIGKQYGEPDTWRPDRTVWAAVHRVLTPTGSLHMTVSNKHLPYWIDEVRAAGFRFLHCSVYHNTSRRAGNWNGQFAYAWEPILSFSKTGTIRLARRMMTDVFTHTGKKHTKHPAERDLSVWREFVALIPGQRILDPFLGSGTTGVVALEQGRDFVGIEREPAYHAIAAQRIAAAALQQPLAAPALALEAA